MSDYERRYYLVPTESQMMAKINEAIAAQKAFQNAMDALKVEFGAKSIWTLGNVHFSALEFEDGKAPEGWRKRKDKPGWVPDRKHKLGREIHKRIDSIPRGSYGGWEMCKYVGNSHWADGHVYFAVPEKVGDQWILSVHVDLPEEPEGLTAIKRSQYWDMREKAEAPNA